MEEVHALWILTLVDSKPDKNVYFELLVQSIRQLECHDSHEEWHANNMLTVMTAYFMHDFFRNINMDEYLQEVTDTCDIVNRNNTLDYHLNSEHISNIVRTQFESAQEVQFFAGNY